MLGGGVATDAEHDGLGTLELGVFITERAGFLRSARRIVLGIEEKDDMFALYFLQRQRAATIRLSSKRRSRITYLEGDIWAQCHRR